MSRKLGIICHHQGARSPRCDEYSFEIFRIALDFDLQLNPKIPCRRLRFLHILRCLRTGLADQKRNFSKVWKQLSNHLQSLRYDIGADGGHSRDVAAGPAKAYDK